MYKNYNMTQLTLPIETSVRNPKIGNMTNLMMSLYVLITKE